MSIYYQVNGDTMIIRTDTRFYPEYYSEYTGGQLYASGVTKVEVEGGSGDRNLPANCAKMFYQATSLKSISGFGYLSTSEVESMESMFQGCTALEEIDFSGFDMHNVKTTESMFDGCTALTSINMSNCDMRNNLSMHRMFYNCNSAETIKVSNMNVSSVQYMNNVFTGCYNVQYLDLTGWDTSSAISMTGMFGQCAKAVFINVSTFDTSNVAHMADMFVDCINVSNLPVENWDTSKVTQMNYLFHNCNSLEHLDLSNWNVGNVTDFESMFGECASLSLITANDWIDQIPDLSAVNSTWMFNDCNLLPNYPDWQNNTIYSAHDCNDNIDPAGYFNVEKGKLLYLGDTKINDSDTIILNDKTVNKVYKRKRCYRSQ